LLDERKQPSGKAGWPIETDRMSPAVGIKNLREESVLFCRWEEVQEKTIVWEK